MSPALIHINPLCFSNFFTFEFIKRLNQLSCSWIDD